MSPRVVLYTLARGNNHDDEIQSYDEELNAAVLAIEARHGKPGIPTNSIEIAKA